MNALKKAPSTYIPPSRFDLGNKLLDAEFEKAQQKVRYALSNVNQTKATVTADGMTYQGTPFENYFVLCNRKVIFWKCEDVTEHLQEGGLRDGVFIAEGLIEVIEELGPKNVLHVVLDGASNNEVAREMLEHKYPHISMSHCLLHVCNLFFGDLRDIPEIAEIFEIKDSIISFFRSRTTSYRNVEETDQGAPRARVRVHKGVVYANG